MARRRLVLIFLLAILLPALVVGYLSLRAFAERRDATRRLLESHLYVSGESALRAVEASLAERERRALSAEDFTVLDAAGRDDRPEAGVGGTTAAFPGTPFLLDDAFLIVLPRTGGGSEPLATGGAIAPGSKFSRAFRRAETYEYSRQDPGQAAQAYREAVALASIDREKAIALGAAGRCLIAVGNLTHARRVYSELVEKYGHIQDQAGHFFGLTAALQTHEIDRRETRALDGVQVLLGIYQGLRDGAWLVSRPEYDFLTSEINSLVEADLRTTDAPEIGRNACRQHCLPRPACRAAWSGRDEARPAEPWTAPPGVSIEIPQSC